MSPCPIRTGGAATTPDSQSVLFIAYHYPPVQSGGVERTRKFVQYLPRHGYQPRILTTSAFGGQLESGDANTVDVLRAWEPVGLYRQLRHQRPHAAPLPSRVRTDPGRLRGLRRLLMRHVFIPDGQLFWIPQALGVALRSLQRRPLAALYSTSPPASSHLLALLIKRLTDLPWIADFRDSWIHDPLDPLLAEHPWRRNLESQMERSVLHDADLVVTTTRLSAEYLRTDYPDCAHKVRVITNGFDPGDFPAQDLDSPMPPETTLRLVHTGSFAASHPLRSPEPLLTALQRLRERDSAWERRIHLTLAGNLTADEVAAAAPLVAAGMVVCPGPLPRQQALELQARAHVLVLMDHSRPWPASNVPGKLFEYLASGRPLLALCGPGMVAETMEALDCGVRVPAHGGDELVSTLIALYEQAQEDRLPTGAASTALVPYHRQRLAGQLAACFDQVLGREGPP